VSELPPGTPFNEICPAAANHGNPHRYCYCGWIEPEPPKPFEAHAYIRTPDLNMGVKHATRLALDRARQAGFNPRKGTVTVYFEDDGVGAKWISSS